VLSRLESALLPSAPVSDDAYELAVRWLLNALSDRLHDVPEHRRDAGRVEDLASAIQSGEEEVRISVVGADDELVL
jgi:hypothetical protein